MRVVDTNVLLHAVNPGAKHHKRVVTKLEASLHFPGTWLLTWGIAYEFLRVSTHANVFDRPLSNENAWRFLRSFVARGARILTPTDGHQGVLELCLCELPALTGSRMHDLHTAVLMREHGIVEISTFDTDFRSFPWVRVLDPLA